MQTLAELYESRKAVLDTVKVFDRKISEHPEHIAKHFTDDLAGHPGCAAIIAKVEMIEDAEGWTDSRKNPVQWSGYRFRLKDDPQTYWMRDGSNWCSDFCDAGKDGDEACADVPLGQMQNAEDKLPDFIAGQPETYMAVACMLRALQGW